MLWIVIGWLIFSIVVGAAAGARGRSGFAWVLLSLLISPLVAVIVLAILPDLRVQDLPRRGTVALLLVIGAIVIAVMIFRVWLG